MDNYTVFNDSQGVYTYTFEAERKVGKHTVNFHRKSSL